MKIERVINMKEKTIIEMLRELTSSQRKSLKQDMMMEEAIASAELAKKKSKSKRHERV